MARSGKGRGTRKGRGILSGTTLATKPSGVTLDAGGVNLGNSMFKMSGGSITWAGTTIVVNTGLTSVAYFKATLGRTGAGNVSGALGCEWTETGHDGLVTTLLRAEATHVAPGATLPAAAGSMTWMAFGT